ncbi:MULTISPECIES: cupin domain-containing protein [Mangrovibacter]|uniref:XRE family transcriptional regulator n=1 Tax=Mangrovibacter plantisponsor TaxID=451513 RepID=A0A317PZC8_9ENTR|nr:MULTISPECIES: cupin domain-containing protein [Mangrovibacter]KEA53371.1 XRE family transcriptional regulator [Mangrovibacter sp. MFB070]PWW09165.1 XRE family transcriptional regulator [Mangrovibacter plantisponsor]
MKKKTDPKSTGTPASLGMRLRHARLVREMTLKQLASQVNCSESFLSKLENDAANPSLTMLHHLAKTLETSVSDLMSEDWAGDSPVMKPAQRHRKRFLQRNKKGGIELENLTWHHKGGLLQGDIHIIEPGVKSDALIEHQGEEMGYVLEGILELRIGEETWQLEAGDSFYFPSHLPHGYSNPGKSVTKVLWVNTPVTF